jgi:DUF1680 family protein
VALARGPVVYCLEHADLPAELAGTLFEDLELDPAGPLELGRSELSPVTIRIPVRVRRSTSDDLYGPFPGGDPSPTDPVTVPVIPYFQWANRAAGPMRVWIPLASDS